MSRPWDPMISSSRSEGRMSHAALDGMFGMEAYQAVAPVLFHILLGAQVSSALCIRTDGHCESTSRS